MVVTIFFVVVGEAQQALFIHKTVSEFNFLLNFSFAVEFWIWNFRNRRKFNAHHLHYEFGLDIGPKKVMVD